MVQRCGFLVFLCLALCANRVSLHYSPILIVLNLDDFFDQFAVDFFSCDAEKMDSFDIDTLKLDCQDPAARCEEQSAESKAVREQNRLIIAAALLNNNFTLAEADAVSEEACDLVFQQKMCQQVSRGIPFIEPADDCMDRVGAVAPGGSFFGKFIVRLLLESEKYATEPSTQSPATTEQLSSTVLAELEYGYSDDDNSGSEEMANTTTNFTVTTNHKMVMLCRAIVKAQNLSDSVLRKCLTLDPKEFQALLVLLDVVNSTEEAEVMSGSMVNKNGYQERSTGALTTTTPPPPTTPLTPKQLIFRICSLIVHSSDMASVNFMRCLQLREEFYRKRLMAHLQQSIDSASLTTPDNHDDVTTMTESATSYKTTRTIATSQRTTKATSATKATIAAKATKPPGITGINLACRKDVGSCFLCGSGVGVQCPAYQKLFSSNEEAECQKACQNADI